MGPRAFVVAAFHLLRRGGRVAEGGGLLNRCTVKSCTGGSNPPLSVYVRKPLILIVLSGWRIDSWTFCPTLKMESMG
jgi:hypothetical protein